MTLAEFVERALPVPFVERGRDYAGWDCWGLVCCGFRDVWGITLPSYATEYEAPQRSVAGLDAMRGVVERATAPAGLWRPVARASAGDVIVLCLHNRPIHVGLMLDAVRFIHAEAGVGASIDQTASPLWQRRIDGIFRYVG